MKDWMTERGVLGSGSPRRKALLEQLGLQFSIQKAGIDESIPPETNAQEAAEWLARQKSAALQHQVRDGAWLITADTMVLSSGEMLNKPADLQEARQMLMRLSGHSHQVNTGVCIYYQGRMLSFSVSTLVHFYPLTQFQIERYLQRDEVLDKAGAYGIQDWIGLVGVKAIEGCFFNVMGLPTSRLVWEMNQF